MAIRLCSYHPLVETKAGQRAILRHGLPPFVDSSCRREPDFESPYPSITALCRAVAFAPYIQCGDTVVYITVRGRWLDSPKEDHWRLTAILRIIERCESHAEAASWYRDKGLALPSNCMVPGNPPLPLEMTGLASRGRPAPTPPTLTGRPLPMVDETLAGWDASYKRRSSRWGVFLVSEAEHVDVHTPPAITRQTMVDIFRRVPGTQMPAKIMPEHLAALKELCLKGI